MLLLRGKPRLHNKVILLLLSSWGLDNMVKVPFLTTVPLSKLSLLGFPIHLQNLAQIGT